MTTFALVHGAWHGAWCWERLIPELEAAGDRAVAMDLPSDDAGAGFPDYADAVIGALEGEDDVVLVGHSLAGHTIPLVAERRPVRALVFLCALAAQPGKSFGDQLTAEPDMIAPGYDAGLSEVDAQGRRRWVDEALARETMFADCDPEAARWAFERLRPQALTPYGQPSELQAMPDVPRAYVLGAEDQLVNPDWSRRAARERLGVDPVELPGSHSPFLARPAELATVLRSLAAT